MNLPSQSSVIAFGRHVVTFAAGGVTFALAIHAFTPAQGADATGAINNIVDGTKLIIAGATSLIGLCSGLYSAWKASPLSQMLSVARNPDVQKVVTTPTVAAAVPSNKVVSS